MPKVGRMFTRHAKLCAECDRPLDLDEGGWFCRACEDEPYDPEYNDAED